MGCKSIKNAFNIQHKVHAEGDFIYIGSDYISDLININVKTGDISPNSSFPSFIENNYPQLLCATKDEILELISKDDTFENNFVVYTYYNGEVIEKKCEALGYPNTTHDGMLMYDNRFSHNKELVAVWAIKDAKLGVVHHEREIKSLKDKIKQQETFLQVEKGYLADLQSKFPTIDIKD